MAKKQPQFDWLRLWPIAVVAVGALTGYIRLQGSVASASEKQVETSKRIDKVEDQQDKLYENSVEQKVQTAQVAQKLDLLLTYVQDSKKK